MVEYPHLLLENLSTGYAEPRGRRTVSSELNLGISSGEVVMLMGPNGSGKSTLMHTIAGLLPPLSGQVKILGRSLARLGRKEVAQALSLVLTERVEGGNMTVWDVVALGRYPYTNFFGKLQREDEKMVAEAVEQSHLKGMEHRLITELSDGERQRVMVARALAQDTPLILLDEPTAHLDLPSRLDLVLMLRRLAHELGKSMLVSTHELDLALSWGDRLWLMDREGKVVSDIPEALVLGGHVGRVFGTEELSYDVERGEFLVQREDLRPICLVAEGMPSEDHHVYWTMHALSRLGYKRSEDTETGLKLVVTPTDWQIKDGEEVRSYGSLTDLVSALS
jgi:putative iron compound ABC transporter ATP-binding protein